MGFGLADASELAQKHKFLEQVARGAQPKGPSTYSLRQILYQNSCMLHWAGAQFLRHSLEAAPGSVPDPLLGGEH